MSLHAQLSPQAQAALAAQKRTSTISALIISVLAFGLVILILMVIALTVNIKSPPEIISYPPVNTDEPKRDLPEIPNEVMRKPSSPSSPSSSMAKMLASASSSPTAVPVPDIEVTEPSLDFGNDHDFDDGLNDGDGNDSGVYFKNLPTTIKKRCSKADRLARLDANGGSEQCEEAVMKSLRWLQKTQNSDGSWTKGNKGAMTGFAVLALLGHCETPISAEFGETVENAIVYLVNLGMESDGRLATAAVGSHHWVYEHGIATYALAEAYTFCDSLGFEIPNLAEVTKTAGDMIIAGQTDSSGVLAFQMWGKPNAKEVRQGVKYIRANTDFKWDGPSSDLYYHYYNAQAMINRGGEDWKFYNDLFRDELLTNQNQNGSWKNSNKHSGNLHMSTCLATFMLEVYYRFLPSSSK
ncbi:hypothetical protein [Rubritalea profundi]|uniref:Squalene cyclase C-terminal domain-containing protein n=1 Tax=Rubritalea profundi TaxID=1658618 RepID=A0A2S7TYD2_9BACT|nr:hypothetical protein [Rubritalea profundi]PQJ27072.1 hypothetical protein BSZ32_00175 [Rubritalea profundi]